VTATAIRGGQRRWIVVGCVVAIFGAAIVGGSLLIPFETPVRIAGGSMAPTLYGEHHRVACGDCGFVFRCDVWRPADSGIATCPNCGGKNSLENNDARPGQLVTIDRQIWAGSAPERWDLVAFTDPERSERAGVKRLVGLPGERITILHGDIYANDQLIRKPLAVQRRLAALVHDDRFRPAAKHALPARWQGDAATTSWQAIPGGYRVAGDVAPPSSGDTSSPDWLTYRHWRCYAGPYARSEEAAISDQYGYNQGVSRQTQSVSDVFFEARCDLPEGGRMSLRVHDGRERFRCDIDSRAGHVRLLRAGNVLLEKILAMPRQSLVEFGVFDRQVVLAIDREEVFRVPYEPAELPRQPTSRPLAIGSDGSRLTVTGLRVYRDLYYLDPRGLAASWQAPASLGADRYLVLGDNAPISRDSRQWSDFGLSRHAMIGKVRSLGPLSRAST